LQKPTLRLAARKDRLAPRKRHDHAARKDPLAARKQPAQLQMMIVLNPNQNP
jgi:hypothetical protein